MRAFSRLYTFTSPTHHSHTTPASAIAVHASSFEGEPLTTHLDIPQSSSSATNHFSLPPTSGVTAIDTRTVRAHQKVLPRPISVTLPSLNITLGSVPYDYGSSVPVHLSSSQSRSWLTAVTSTPTGPSTTPPHPPLSCGSVSPSTGSSQTTNLTQNAVLSPTGLPQSHSLPPLPCEVSAVLTAPSQIEEAVDLDTVDIILPDVPMYDPLFLQWLHARRVWMISQGRRDPLLVGPSFLARIFDRWLQQW